MSSDKHNLIMAKATGLVFSLLYITSVTFGIPQYIHCVFRGLTYVLLCVTFMITNSARCRFVAAPCDGFPTFVIGISEFSVVTGLVAEILS